MKIIHTADWHLGKVLFKNKLIEDQRFLLEQLISLIDEEKPDAMIIAGDVYDRTVPPSEAVSLLDWTLKEIALVREVPVFMIAGNHDSPERVDFASSFMHEKNLFIKGLPSPDIQPFMLKDEWGPVDFYLMPFVDPAFAKMILQKEAIHSHDEAVGEIMKRLSGKMKKDRRNVLVTHAFVQGGAVSDSERPLSVGGSGAVSPAHFSDFDYTALGHLHRPQRINDARINYSGSLMKYSFSEATHQKSVSVVVMDKDGAVTLKRRDLKPDRDLRIVEDTLENILSNSPEEDKKRDYILARLTDDRAMMNPLERLREIYPNIMKIERNRSGINENRQSLSIQEKEKMKDIDLFESFFKQINPEDRPFDEDLRKAVEKIFLEIQKDDD